MTAAVSFAQAGDTLTSTRLVGAARRQLGLIGERLAAFGHPVARRQLLADSRRLQAASANPARLAEWLDRFEAGTVPTIAGAAETSLYNPTSLTGWLERTRPGAQPAASGRQRSTKPLLPVNG